MGNKNDYEALIEKIKAIAIEKAKRPHKSVDEILYKVNSTRTCIIGALRTLRN